MDKSGWKVGWRGRSRRASATDGAWWEHSAAERAMKEVEEAIEASRPGQWGSVEGSAEDGGGRAGLAARPVAGPAREGIWERVAEEEIDGCGGRRWRGWGVGGCRSEA